MNTDYNSPTYTARLTDEVKRHIGSAGEVIGVTFRGPASGWFAIVSTEYAALKLFHVYRFSKHVTIAESKNLGAWVFSIG